MSVTRKELDQQLVNAVKTNNKDEVEKLLAQGADANTRDESKLPVLQQAVLNGRQDIVQALFDRGADITARNFANKTALDLAGINTGMGRQLIGLANRALFKAIIDNNMHMFQKLLQFGASINDNKAEPPLTPLMFAISKARVTMVALALENGADINMRVDGKTALDFAKQQSNDPIVQVIKNYALLEAAKKMDINKATEFLADGADVNATNASEWTPLALAVQSGSLQMVTKLIENGATVDLEAHFGTPPGDKSLMALTDNTAIKQILADNALLNAEKSKVLEATRGTLESLKLTMAQHRYPSNGHTNSKPSEKKTFLGMFKSNIQQKEANRQSLVLQINDLLDRTVQITKQSELDTFLLEAKKLITEHKNLDNKTKGYFSTRGKIFKALNDAEKTLSSSTKNRRP